MVYLSKGFYSIKTDNKWGSGLRPGSRGHALGFNFSSPPWKLSGMAYDITGNSRQESKYIFEGRYKKSFFEIATIYIYKAINKIAESDKYPYGNIWTNEMDHNIKMNLKVKISPTLRFVCQLQGGVFKNKSYIALFRITHKKNNNSLKFQLTQCNGFENDLYFLRPSGHTYYGIRKAPEDETLYYDLVFSKNLEKFDVFIHLRNEGVSVGISYK